MCGVGLLYSQSKTKEKREAIAEAMHQSISHRGPDGHGVWSSASGVTLFHRRLSIVDLSQAGHQPMVSAQKRWVISFNGEIYNHKHLRESLVSRGLSFQGTSDTEVLLNLIEQDGVEKAIQQCDGMFAAIIFDLRDNRIYLVRDRLGEKPLYYGYVGGDLVVGSELKVFRSHPNFVFDIEPKALSAFFKYNNVPAPLSILKNIYKVKQGHIYTFELGNSATPKIEPYWRLRNFQNAPDPSSDFDYATAKQHIHTQLTNIVGREMQADVPLGCFLSGGIDSSLICALMTRQQTEKISTFTIGFENKSYDESGHAAAVAKHLGTRHTEWIARPADCLSAIEKMAHIYDEPFSDSSQIPTYLLSQMTRQHVKVALSGDGGDELFAGYNRYQWAQPLWNKIKSLPQFMRSPLSNWGTELGPERWDKAYSWLQSMGAPKKLENFGTKIVKGFDYLKAKSPLELHDLILSHWTKPEDILLNAEPLALLEAPVLDLQHFETYMMWHDHLHYLPDDIMVKVDRASMACSLEVRAPFLDHNLIDCVSAMNPKLVRSGQRPKQITRDILYEYVPKEIIERPKMGFGIPIADWLKNDLRDLVESVLSREFLTKQGLFKIEAVLAFKDQQLNGRLNRPYHLWDLLIFQLWYSEWSKN